MPKMTKDLRADLRLFAFYLANGTIDCELLPPGTDYSAVLQEPSALEQVFAIWGNVLDMDADGRPTNAGAAQRRAAQYVRSFIKPGYVVQPPFEEWELELHI